MRQSIYLVKVCIVILLLSGCDELEGLGLNLSNAANNEAGADVTPGRSVEREVEAPEVFSVTEAGLWDGRPSLGGVWVAHPDVTEPERVIIRNQANGKFVVGALFRREREIPGPRLQVSSDAAVQLAMLAGAPVELDVTALRKEIVPEEPFEQEVDDPLLVLPEETVIAEAPLDPIAAASAAIDAAEPTPLPAETDILPRPVSTLEKPFIQIGIFSVQANAERTAAQMQGAGLTATISTFQTGGKTFRRVVVGPAATKADRNALLADVKNLGFLDAYPVTD